MKAFKSFLIKIIMYVLLLGSSSLLLVPRSFPLLLHEIIGTALFCIVLFHIYILRDYFHYKEQKSFTSIYKNTLLVLVAVSFCVVIISGIGISRYLFSALDLGSGRVYHQLHTGSVYLFLIFASMHAGFYFDRFFALISESLGHKSKIAIICALYFIALNALPLIFSYEFIDKITFNQSFSFFDDERSVWLYIVDNFSIGILFALLSYNFYKLFLHFDIQRIRNKNAV